MKALTICQPYAHLIVHGDKRVENRDWFTPYRGPLMIHAGLSRSWLGQDDAKKYPDMVFGAIVGVVDLEACLVTEDIPQFVSRHPQYAWLPNHPHLYGPYAWVLKNVRVIQKPIPCRGRMGLWEYNDFDMSLVGGP